MKKKNELLYKLETDLPFAGNGLTYSKKEWKRIYGYDIGLIAGVRFALVGIEGRHNKRLSHERDH